MISASEAWDIIIHNHRCLESCGDVFLRAAPDLVSCQIDGCMDADVVMDRVQFLMDYEHAPFKEHPYD